MGISPENQPTDCFPYPEIVVGCGRMKTILSMLLFALSLAAPSMAFGESIGIVDTQFVLNQSIIGKAARSNLEARVKKAQAGLGQRKTQFDKERAALEKQAKVLSGAALESKKEALGKKQLDLQRAYQDAQEELAKANEQEIAKVVGEIQAAVKEFAKERNLTFVFEKDRQTVLYASDRIDISSDVVKILDKKKVAL
jgi:outer membrane protein